MTCPRCQGPVKGSRFVACDAEEAVYVIYRSDSQDNIVCGIASCLWVGPDEDCTSQKGTHVTRFKKAVTMSQADVCKP